MMRADEARENMDYEKERKFKWDIEVIEYSIKEAIENGECYITRFCTTSYEALEIEKYMRHLGYNVENDDHELTISW